MFGAAPRAEAGLLSRIENEPIRQAATIAIFDERCIRVSPRELAESY